MIISTNYQDIFSLKKEQLSKIDNDLYNFLEFWRSNKNSILVETSGSTGPPKQVEITRTSLINSAQSTLEYFKLKEGSKFHCCLPIKYIGGKMMLIRAFLNKGKIVLTKPSINTLKNLNEQTDFSAMTPLQASKAITEKEFNNINKLIIGGGKISTNLIEKLNKTSTHCYQTFGMTETASHIAIRDLRKHNKDMRYKCLNHVEISTNKNSQLIIKSDALNIESITTNDIVEVFGNKHFTYIGRLDNIINSGGMKINPESIERKLYQTMQNDNFFIDKISDNILGEKMILISLKTIKIELIEKAISSIKDKKFRPKLIIQNKEFYYTENNKLNRKKTLTESLKNGTHVLIK